jgi:small-conductance mechanosensitive channel
LLKTLEKLAKKTDTDFDDFFINVINSLPWYFYWVIYVYIPLLYLHLDPFLSTSIQYVFVAIIGFQLIKLSIKVVEYFLAKLFLSEKSKIKDWQTTYNLFSLISKIFLWIIWIIFILMNVWVEVTPLIASLWVWSVAIAFALQNIIEDIFSSFSIYFDRPFSIGDFISTWSDIWTVHKIWIKSTRIITLQWQELIVSNKELTNSRVENFGRMKQRRISTNIGVIYETPIDKLKMINWIIEKIFGEKEIIALANLDRVHFSKFLDSSLNFDIVYHVLESDYNIYMDVQQKINFRIMEEFEKAWIEFAYPTQVIYTKN